MKITVLNSGVPYLPDEILKKVQDDITTSVSSIVANSASQFIINPTIWYSIVKTKQGETEAKPRVVNSADFLSDKFGETLSKLGWHAGAREKTVNGQTIDGYIEIEAEGDFHKIEEAKFLNFFNQLIESKSSNFPSLRSAFNYYYSRFCKDGWKIPKEFEQLKHHFEMVDSRKVKIGVEFETGNIASSFRALSKLESLFHGGHIDFGVFITSLDKATTAAKIWPISNRNGSFEELKKRNYKAELTVPLLEIGFQPDGYSDKAGYLGASGETFQLKQTSETEILDGIEYQKYEYKNTPYWKKK